MAGEYKIQQHAGRAEHKAGVLVRSNRKPWKYPKGTYGWMTRRQYKEARKLLKKRFAGDPRARFQVMQNLLGLTDEEYQARRI